MRISMVLPMSWAGGCSHWLAKVEYRYKLLATPVHEMAFRSSFKDQLRRAN